jgi:hypothetical protein
MKNGGRVTVLVVALAFVGVASAGDAQVSVRELGGCSHALPWTQASEVRDVRRDGSELVVEVLANAACGGMEAQSPAVDVREKATLSCGPRLAEQLQQVGAREAHGGLASYA